MAKPGLTQLRIGFVPLVDCVTIVAAKERGEFEREGLDVSLVRHESWAAIRDRLAYGDIEAAHLLSPIVVASSVGLGPFPGRFMTSLALNLNGNAITASNALFEEMTQDRAIDSAGDAPFSASRLSRIIDRRRASGAPKLAFGVVYPFSMHNYQLRYWLAAGGVHPDNDVRIVVVPPSRMVEAMSSGSIDAYCVGEPWNSEAVQGGVGRVLITSAEIWSNGPEKVLGVRRDWAGKNSETHRALIRALLRASAWVDRAENRRSAAELIASPNYVDLPVDRLAPALTGMGLQTGGVRSVDMPDFSVFHRYAANFPWRSHAAWIATQMLRWGQAAEGVDVIAVAEAAFDPAPYREAARELDVPTPTQDRKIEGLHATAWILNEATAPIAMGPDQLLDGVGLDDMRAGAYLASFPINSMRRPSAKVVSS